jgi:copper chaperone CopZ
VTWKVWIIPIVIVALSFAGLMGAKQISLPTLTYMFDKDFGGRAATAKLTVDGVRCYGTANALREHIAGLPGLVSMVAYGGRHRVDLQYDPERLGLDQITEAIARPISTRQGPMAFFKVVSAEVK